MSRLAKASQRSGGELGSLLRDRPTVPGTHAIRRRGPREKNWQGVANEISGEKSNMRYVYSFNRHNAGGGDSQGDVTQRWVTGGSEKRSPL